MAGDWFPIEEHTPRKSEVLGIARRTGLDRRFVVGALVEFWAWVQTQTVDGRVDANVDVLATLLSLPHEFFHAMIDVGWLKEDGDTLVVPNADHWLGEGAKSRLLRNRRQQRYRNKVKASTESSTKPSTRLSTSVDKNVSTSPYATEEKRREEKSSGVYSPDDSSRAENHIELGPITLDELTSNIALAGIEQSLVDSGRVASGDRDRLRVWAAAERDIRIGRDHGSLFRHIVFKGNWHILTAVDESAALSRIKSHYGGITPRPPASEEEQVA